jgi:hypothetical protein
MLFFGLLAMFESKWDKSVIICSVVFRTVGEGTAKGQKRKWSDQQSLRAFDEQGQVKNVIHALNMGNESLRVIFCPLTQQWIFCIFYLTGVVITSPTR